MSTVCWWRGLCWAASGAMVTRRVQRVLRALTMWAVGRGVGSGMGRVAMAYPVARGPVRCRADDAWADIRADMWAVAWGGQSGVMAVSTSGIVAGTLLVLQAVIFRPF